MQLFAFDLAEVGLGQTSEDFEGPVMQTLTPVSLIGVLWTLAVTCTILSPS